MDERKTQPLDLKTVEMRRVPAPAAKAEDDFQVGQSRILQMIAAGAPLSEILTRLVLLIEAQSPDMLCSVLLLSDDGNHIRHGAAPSLSEKYVKAIDGAPIGPKHGSCGTAMYRGQPVIVADIFTDPLWTDYRDLAAAAELRACWSTPIMSGRGKVLGSFAMYYREPRTPTGEEAGLTEVATRVAGLAIEHQSARETLARTQAKLAAVTTTHASAITDDAAKSEAAASIAQDLNEQLEAIVKHADTCLNLLADLRLPDESEPSAARLREALGEIAKDARHALEVFTRIAPGQ